jgi:hypothetical protein
MQRRTLSDLFHAKCMIGRKLDYAAVLLHVKIITFLSGTGNQAILRPSQFLER